MAISRPRLTCAARSSRTGKSLLVQEAGDGLWSLPGGWADVGDSPVGQAVEREIREEKRLSKRARPSSWRSTTAIGAIANPHFAVYKLFFLCDLIGGEATTSEESLAVDWFAPDKLPPLSQGRVTEAQIGRWFLHWRQPDLPTEFD